MDCRRTQRSAGTSMCKCLCLLHFTRTRQSLSSFTHTHTHIPRNTWKRLKFKEFMLVVVVVVVVVFIIIIIIFLCHFIVCHLHVMLWRTFVALYIGAPLTYIENTQVVVVSVCTSLNFVTVCLLTVDVLSEYITLRYVTLWMHYVTLRLFVNRWRGWGPRAVWVGYVILHFSGSTRMQPKRPSS